MGKFKIHEIAKELGLGSKEVIAKAKELGIEVTSHLSSVEEELAQKIKKSFGKQEKKEEKGNKKEATTPVIIRREVILADEEVETKKEEKVDRKDVGFVERKKNQDFNIVYRKQPTKPMTVSELFGIKNNKKEEVKKEEPVAEETKKVEEKEVIETKKEEVVEKVVEQKKEVKPIDDNKETDTVKQSKNESDSQSGNTNQNHFENRNNQNRFNNRQDGQNRFENRGRADNQNRFGNQRGEYNNQNRFGDRNNQNRFHNRQDGQNRFENRGRADNQNRFGNQRGEYNNQNRFGDRNNQNRFGNNNQRPGRFNRNANGARPLDNRGIDRNIKDIMASDIVEKEDKRDISTRAIDKEKANRYEDNKAKKGTKAKKGDRFQEEFNEGKLKDLKQVDKLSHMFNEQDGGMLDYYDLTTARGKKNKRKPQREEERNKQKIFELKEITIPAMITVKDLATEMKKTSGEVIKKLFNYGIMATINNTIDFDTAFLVAEEFGITAIKKEEVKEEDILFDETEDTADELEPRPPVVVVMGHVDHGKTSLLDAIRSTNVIEGEAGGITQHIGAYKVNVNNREITFLDTPGHEAFTAMRARGAQITDVAILIVAADDGVMPQTVEAINHAKAAEIPIIVAVNKIDLPGANVEKIKQELMEYELVPEEWGGDTIYVPISAKKKINIDNLLEMVLLVADMKELKANPNKQAKGTVIEARLDKAKGPIASMLVQRGTLDEGDTIVVGKSIGRIRAMKNDKGQKVKKAGPSTPVEIMGLTEVPEAGDTFYEVKNEKMAKHLIERRKRQEREQAINENSKVTLSNLFEKMESENLKQLNIIVKADVQGTAQALKQSLEKLSNEEVRVRVIHAVAGAVTESDVQLAKAGNCIIIAFNVRPVNTAKDMAEKEAVEIKQYSVIYQAIEDVEAAMKGMLDPIYEEKVIGNAVVRQTFRVSGVGTIAGAYVLDGKIERNAGVRVIRENVVIHDGKLISLKRFKDDAKEVSKGFECGLQIEGYNDVKEDDTLEFYIMEEVKR
ncbi:MAG: translation initiation factor IF-2 [Clostridia bacterium]|nr:translation initiation factor IF-2 [Clostridia bacterium]